MSNTPSTKRVNKKQVTVMVAVLRTMSDTFANNDLQACISVLNPNAGRHSLAKDFAEMLYGELPCNYEDAWNSYPNTGLTKSNKFLHDVIGQAKVISDLTKTMRTMCRRKANGQITLKQEQRLLEDIKDVIDQLIEFTD